MLYRHAEKAYAKWQRFDRLSERLVVKVDRYRSRHAAAVFDYQPGRKRAADHARYLRSSHRCAADLWNRAEDALYRHPMVRRWDQLDYRTTLRHQHAWKFGLRWYCRFIEAMVASKVEPLLGRAKTALWYDTPQPLLGWVSPRHLAQLGKGDKVLDLIDNLKEGDLP